MKYIRTKDGKIFDTQYEPKVFKYNWNAKFIIDDNNLIVYDTVFKDRIANHGQILKQADAIEELCDELVFEWHRSSISHDNDTWHLYHKVSLKEEVENALNDGFRASIEEVKNIYGAIWTNKGLIYVAKMNDKGELGLL